MVAGETSVAHFEGSRRLRAWYSTIDVNGTRRAHQRVKKTMMETCADYSETRPSRAHEQWLRAADLLLTQFARSLIISAAMARDRERKSAGTVLCVGQEFWFVRFSPGRQRR